MPSDTLPQRLLTAWVYMPKGIKTEFKLRMMIQHKLAYLFKSPNFYPSVREAFTREAAHARRRSRRRKTQAGLVEGGSSGESEVPLHLPLPGAHRRSAARATTGEGLLGCRDSGGATGPRAHAVAAARDTDERKGCPASNLEKHFKRQSKWVH